MAGAGMLQDGRLEAATARRCADQHAHPRARMHTHARAPTRTQAHPRTRKHHSRRRAREGRSVSMRVMSLIALPCSRRKHLFVPRVRQAPRLGAWLLPGRAAWDRAHLHTLPSLPPSRNSSAQPVNGESHRTHMGLSVHHGHAARHQDNAPPVPWRWPVRRAWTPGQAPSRPPLSGSPATLFSHPMDQ